MANAIQCNDGNACTDADACQGGACKSGKPTDCNDANTCTVDLCDPAKGCTYQKMVNATPCNDGDLCTSNDTCQNGICMAGSKVTCNDGEPCTTDTCEPKPGCVFTPLADTTPCDDKSLCTLVDTCVKAKCTGTGGVRVAGHCPRATSGTAAQRPLRRPGRCEIELSKRLETPPSGGSGSCGHGSAGSDSGNGKDLTRDPTPG